MTSSPRFHTVVVKVENKAGVLARVAGLFARRGFNIESLAVAQPTRTARLSTLVHHWTAQFIEVGSPR